MKKKIKRLCKESERQATRFFAAFDQMDAARQNGEEDFQAFARMTDAYLGFRQVLVDTYFLLLAEERKNG